MTSWDGEQYQSRFDAMAAAGQDVHGEATFVLGLRPSSVLDAGCGTGRVAIELRRHGVDVVGTDIDASMLAVAETRAPAIPWILADLATLALDRTFDVVVMAGNVLVFLGPGTHAAVVARCAAHLAPGGALVAGFQLGRGYDLERYDADCRAAGLELAARFATWDRQPWPGGGDYAVSVHHLAASPTARESEASRR